MRVIKRKSFLDYWKRHPETEQPLESLYSSLRKAKWHQSQDISNALSAATVLNSRRVKFDICGGNYHVIIEFQYVHQIAWIKFIGTHKEYDAINAKTIDIR